MNKKIIHVAYDFDYDDEVLDITEDEFYDFMQNDYQAFQEYMCDKYSVPCLFSYDDILTKITVLDSDTDDEVIESMINYISDVTGWLVMFNSLNAA